MMSGSKGKVIEISNTRREARFYQRFSTLRSRSFGGVSMREPVWNAKTAICQGSKIAEKNIRGTVREAPNT
jgi:hypothetical protein